MRKKINWTNVEKYSIYASLILGLASNIVEAIWPSLKLLPPIFLGLAVLGAFHYLIRAVEEGRGGGHVRIPKLPFPSAFQEWLGFYDTVNDIRIASYTSTVYYQFIQANSVRVKKLRLLLLIENDPQTTCANLKFNFEQTVAHWRALHLSGQIRSLEIRRIAWHTPMYFSIAESDRVLAGLLWPNPDLRDVKAMDAILVSRHQAQHLVQHLIKWFDDMWEVAAPVHLNCEMHEPPKLLSPD